MCYARACRPDSEMDQSGVEPRPDFGEMVVVVFGNEIEMVDETQRLLEPRVQEGLREDGALEHVEFFDKSRAGGSKLA